MITLTYRSELAVLTQKNQEAIPAGDVRAVLAYIKTNYGTQAHKQAKRMLIAVNGESILLREGLRTPLRDGDAVAFYPMAGGG